MSKSSDWAARNLQPIEPGPEHHVITDLAARLAKAERALEEAEKVIEPFAMLTEFYMVDARDNETADGATPDVGHLRAARQWMESRHD